MLANSKPFASTSAYKVFKSFDIVFCITFRREKIFFSTSNSKNEFYFETFMKRKRRKNYGVEEVHKLVLINSELFYF